ncbi:MAG TPA: amidohydrolase [Candidatus Limnocylindria bacterium]|nr:amidohydrolase [Candidatus Limnocylindria bacterium]
MWTVDPARPEAEAVAVQGDRIARVGRRDDVFALKGPRTEVIDLRGRLLLPGFIDAHTHFGNAAAWLFRVGLYEAREPSEVVAAVAAAARRIPKGMWISGGDIGAADAWAADAGGRARPSPMPIDRRALDAAAPDHPVLLRRVDGAYVANAAALARARLGSDAPDPRGGRSERDAAGELTGVMHGRAGERMVELMPPRTLEQDLVGAREALADLRRAGITSIHDVARLDAVSQRTIFHTDVERSATDLEIFRELQRRGELSVRVYAFLTLALWREVVAAGIRPRSDEGLIRFGALKAFIDGFLMDEPYADRPGFAGSFTFRFADEATLAADIAGADAAGFEPVVHTIGDRAHRLLLDWYEAAIAANPRRDRRFRVIHAWYPSAREIARIGKLGLIVDVTPQQLVNDVSTVERRLGPQRARTAHAWRSLIEAGARLDLVSDWPGSYNEQRATPLAPLENIALAVTRDWHADQRLTVAEAIAAYTIHPAYASYEEDRKGSLTEGKLADLVVVSSDILAVPPAAIRDARVDLTIFGGRVADR